jgi:hypothetical protein
MAEWVLYKSPNLFIFDFIPGVQFLNPLSPHVWICTLASFVVVSIVLYVLERIGSRSKVSPDANAAPRITMRESFWFIFGSLLQGNTDSSPSTVPGAEFCFVVFCFGVFSKWLPVIVGQSHDSFTLLSVKDVMLLQLCQQVIQVQLCTGYRQESFLGVE